MAPASSIETWVVAGAARGIGAALVEQALQKEGTQVFAGARRPASSKKLAELKDIYGDRLQLVTLDVTDEDSAQAASKVIEEAGGAVDILVNNAAVIESMTITTRNMDAKQMLDNIGTNAVGAHLTTRAFLPLLQRGSGKTVINISSVAGSTTTFANMIHSTEATPLKSLAKVQAAYRASKAAMNSVTVSWALDLTPDLGFKFVAIHPGGVMTELAIEKFGEMGLDLNDFAKGTIEMLTPEECAKALMKVINGLQPKDSGKFLDYKGNELPF